MRKLLVSSVFLVLCLVLSGQPAHAQTAVDLFLGSGAVTFTTTVNGSTATANFSASGSALSNSPGGTYTYSLTGGPVTLTQSTPGNYTASSTPLTLTLAGSGGTTGNLTGTVDLVSFQQGSFVGTFNNAFVANVTVTSASGSLVGYAGNSGALLLTLVLPTSTQIDDLGNGNSRVIAGGVGFMLPTPEPVSMLLFGSGLLALGGVIRRRLHTA
jgi:hypothetical protein